MTGKWKPKAKKLVETSLGKAPKETDKGVDVSHLRKPITTSVHGLRQIVALFQTATAEVQDYITYECDILYECKHCKTIFRSLANFILHKREYCREKFQEGGFNPGGFVISEDLKTSDEDSRCATPIEKVEDTLETKKSEKRTISPIIDKLLKKQKINILVKDTVNEDLSSKVDNNNDDDDVIFVSEESNVVLQKVNDSGAAVFQTVIKGAGEALKSSPDLIKNEVMEIHGILDNNQAVLDSSGKVSNTETRKLINPNIPKPDLVCTECNFTFSTEKTLTHHIKYKHNRTCVVFPCPDCKETFSNAWSVYRHLFKVHRRTQSQVRRMRHLVHTSGIRRDQGPERKKRKPNVENEENEENQWMNNFEGDKDFQMCGGCGKRFERKAALHSHSQMCTKRIAVCNSIRSVKAAKEAKKVEEAKPKGAAKRKQKVPTVVKVGEPEDVTKKLVSERDVEPEDTSAVKLPTITEVTITDEPAAEPIPSDVTITKHTEDEPPMAVSGAPVPEIEIFTISDDSEESEGHLPKTAVELSDDYKEYINDEADNCFLGNALSHFDRNELRCIPCEVTFLSLYRLLRHMSLHYSWYRFQCSKCSFVSFHKYDCTTHAYSNHSTPNHLMESTVLPIPKWKVLCTSHDFRQLGDEVSNNNQLKMPQLKPIKENEETIVLEDDEMPDITHSVPFQESVILSDEESRDNQTTVERKKVTKAGPSRVVNDRPIRNRTKSVKIGQNDFIYDLQLAKVFNGNDSSVRSKKKKNLSKV